MKKKFPIPKRPVSPSPPTSRKVARVSESRLLSGSESHRNRPDTIKDERYSPRASQKPNAHMPANYETSTIIDFEHSSSHTDMEDMGHEPPVHGEHDAKVRYQPSDEPRPKMPLHHESFFVAESLALQVPGEIIDIIKNSEWACEGIKYIRDNAKLAKKIESPGDVLVGLTGDSGTGKSSLINSLLGIEEIAPSGNDGEACTAVIQEFRERRKSQQYPYESEIVFFDLAARNRALKGWVTDFWDFEEANPDLADARFLDHVDGATTAATALFSLFCDRPECADIDKTKEFLRTATVRGDPAILTKLQTWTESWLKRHGVWEDRLTKSSHTPDGLRYKIRRYMLHLEDNGQWRPSPWPLVRIIKTFLHASLLEEGIVLADLPGMTDTNLTRSRAAKLYSRDLDYTMVVSNIGRAQTDSGTQRYLTDAFKRRRGPSVCMVATHSDSLDVTDDSLKARIDRARPADAKVLSTLMTQRDITKSRLIRVKRESSQACMRMDTNAMARLMRESNDLELNHTVQCAQVTRKCIEMRNYKVAKEVDRSFSPLMRGASRLPVFCVSNSVYMKHIDGYCPTEPPLIGAQETGIPELRANLRCLPARRKFDSFKDHCQIKLPSLLNSINIAFGDGGLKEHDDLQRMFLSVKDSIPRDIKSVFAQLLEEDLLVVIGKIEANKSGYARHAKSRLASWSNWSWNTYKAFTNNSGNYWTKTAGYRDWNCEMLGALAKDIEHDTRHWDSVSSSLDDTLSGIIEGRVNELVTTLKAEAVSHRLVLQPFMDELHLQRDYLVARCKAVAEDFERNLIILKDSILTTEDIHESYFVLAMQDVYNQVAGFTGTGSHVRRCAVLMDYVSDVADGPFQEMHDRAEAEARKLTEWHAKKLSDEVMKVFQSVYKTFMLGFETEGYDPPGLEALRTKLRAEVPALRGMLRKIDHYLAECEGYGAQ